MPTASDGLNRAQRAAVTHSGGPLVIVAGAGAGKTRTLTRRFGWLVEQGVPADEVLALTFSSAAAAEMRERLESLIEVPYEELHVGTFHSFCSRLLADEALEAGLDPFFTPVTPADRLALLLDRQGELTLRHHEIRGNPAPLLASFVSRIDRLKDEMVSCERFRGYAEELVVRCAGEDDAARAHAARELEFAGVYADHDRLLAEQGALDFGDLIARAYALLHEHPHVRRRVSDRFKHVLVDEYQDTNFAQGMLLALLAEERRQITVVGDDDQAIYRFRGASRKNLEAFREEFPEAETISLERNYRSGQRILDAARAVVEPTERLEKKLKGKAGGEVRFWRCQSERAQAQAVAVEAERLVTGDGVSPDRVAVLVRSVRHEGATVGAALEERALPFRLSGSAAYFQRAEVRDVLAWLRLLADPTDSGAVVRALSRPPIELRSVDVARLTQLARRRKLDMPSAVAAGLEGPQLSPEGRERAQAFLKLYRSASNAFEDRRPDAFVMRLIERIGLRRQQVFARRADTAERLRNIAKLPELATAYMRREPAATPREFTRYLDAVAESGLREEEAPDPAAEPAVRVLTMHAAKGLEFDHVFALGLSAGRMPGPWRKRADGVPDELVPETVRSGEDRKTHEDEMRRLLHVAMTRARKSLVLSFAERGDGTVRGSPFVDEAREALEAEEEVMEEELFGPAEGLHSTFRLMRDELLDTVAEVGGRLAELRLDTYLDVAGGVARYLELLKVAALISRAREGQEVAEALPEINDVLAQGATRETRELLAVSALDDWLRDAARDLDRRPVAAGDGSEPSLDPFIPRRGEGLMLSASDIDTYRLCPLKYKFARVFRIPQEPTIHQRFGIAIHQVLERWHKEGGDIMGHFEAAWRRNGFGNSDDEAQFRERAVTALRRYEDAEVASDAEAVWFERSFSFRMGPHLLRGRVDRVDRHPDGTYELIDYKTGKSKTEADLREDVQLSLYQMGARASWRLETSAQSYMYVLTGEKVPVEHSEEELSRVRDTVSEIAEGIQAQDFEPRPSREICSFCDYRIICPAAER